MKKKKSIFGEGASGKEGDGIVIGIAGAKRSVGTTHVCILLAEYLQMEMGANTAILEYSRHGDFQKLKEAKGFSMKNIAYFEDAAKENIKMLLLEGYSYLILDLGEKLMGNSEILSLCHIKILVSTLSPWRREEFLKIGQSLVNHKKEWLFLSNMGDEKVRKQYERLLNTPVKKLPCCPLGKQPPKEVRRLLTELLEGGMNEEAEN